MRKKHSSTSGEISSGSSRVDELDLDAVLFSGLVAETLCRDHKAHVM